MKVAFISFDFPPLIQGGAAVYAYNLTKELAKLGVDVHVITLKVSAHDKESEEKGIFMHRLDFVNKPLLRAPSFWFSLRKNFSYLEQEVGGFDVIHGNGLADITLSNKLVHSPRVITVHHVARTMPKLLKTSLLTRVKDLGGEAGVAPFLEPICIGRSNKIIAVSNYTREQIMSLYGIPLDRIEVIHNGLQFSNYDFDDNELKSIREEFEIPEKPIILFVGGINDKRKNLETLLKSLNLVLKKVDVLLLIVGSGDIRPYSRFLDGIRGNVVVTGYIDDVRLRKLYSICDVYVCPSRLEGFGLTLIEAMAAGKPVVATNVGAIPEIVINEENGTLVEVDDVTNLANAISTYLQNKQLSARVGQRNKEYARKFSWEKSAKETMRVYNQLIDT